MAHFKSLAPGAGDSATTATSSTRSASYTASSPSTSKTLEVTPTPKRSSNRQDQEAKWAEEERRDALRREKREQERLARLLADQDRITDEEDAADDIASKQPTPVEAPEPGPAQPAEASMTEQLSMETTAPDPQVPQEPLAVLPDAEVHHGDGHAGHADDQSADTILAAESEDFEKGTSGAEEVGHGEAGEKRDDQSATTPLEEEAEEFEHGTHKAVLDESPTEERIRDEL